MRNRILQRLEAKKRKYQTAGFPEANVMPGIGGVAGEATNIMQQHDLQDKPFEPVVEEPVVEENTTTDKLSMLEQAELMRSGGTAPMPKMYNMGGVQNLPGGNMQQIPGTDAVQFNGQSHDQGGIQLDAQTEVEGDETMDQVTMAKKGGKRDYFFSSHLKEGGRSFADMHKDILENGGAQEDIDYLAKMQEQKAGRDPKQVASLGGVMKYQNGTFKAYGDDYTKVEEAYGSQGYTGSGEDGTYRAADLGDENIANVQSGTGSGYYGEVEEGSKEDFYSRNKELLNEMGVNSADEFDPKKHTKDFQTKYNASLTDRWENDEAFRADMESKGMSKESYIDNAGFSGDGAQGVDGKYGEFTWSKSSVAKAPEPIIPPEEEKKIPPPEETKIEQTVEKKQKKDYSGTMLGLAGMIPAVMAFTDKPDYMSQPDLAAPGIVKAERVAKQHLDRVDFNDQLARNASDATAVNKSIDTSGGGPASMSNKMALYAQKQKGDRDVKAQEARANVAIANEEASLDNRRKVYNSEAALDASKFNVGSQERAQSENTRNKMYTDEFNRGADAATKDRKLNAVQYGVNTLASLHRDKLMYKASGDYTRAIDGTRGVMPRFYDPNSTTTTSSSSTTTTTPEQTVPAKRGGYRQMNLIR